MKSIFVLSVLALAFSAFGTNSASAAGVTGSASLTIWPENGAPFSIDIREEGGKILGQGNGGFGSASTIYLEETANGGLRGFALGRSLNIVCSATECSDQGSTNLNLKLSHSGNSTTLDGTLNFVFVHSVLSDSKVSLSADSSYDLTKTSEGNYSGDGMFGMNSFHAQLTTEGALKGLSNPAAFIVLMINPFVR